MFVHQGDVFLGLAESCVGGCSEVVQSGFCFSVDVVSVFECHSVIVSHSECGGHVGAVYGCVIECHCGLLQYSRGALIRPSDPPPSLPFL